MKQEEILTRATVHFFGVYFISLLGVPPSLSLPFLPGKKERERERQREKKTLGQAKGQSVKRYRYINLRPSRFRCYFSVAGEVLIQ